MNDQLAISNQTELQTSLPSADEVKKLICKDATNAEIALFLKTCQATGLNPFLREIYLIKYGTSPASIVTGYQTYLQIAEESGKLNGWNVEIDDEDNPTKATITIHRKDWDFPFQWTVYRKDVDTSTSSSKPRNPWVKQPRHMIRKCVIGMGMRLCFPNIFRGTPYLPEEMTSQDTTDEHTSEALSNIQYPEAEIIEKIPTTQGLPEHTEPDPDKASPSNIIEKTTFLQLQAKYFAYAGKQFETNEPRRAWQLANIGKESIKDWTIPDFGKAIELLKKIPVPQAQPPPEPQPSEELSLNDMITSFPLRTPIHSVIKDSDSIAFYLNTRFITLDLESVPEIAKLLSKCYHDKAKGVQFLAAVGKAAAWGEQIGGRGKARNFIKSITNILSAIPDPEAAEYLMNTLFASLGVTDIKDGIYRLTTITPIMLDNWDKALNAAWQLTTSNYPDITKEKPLEDDLEVDDDLPF